MWGGISLWFWFVFPWWCCCWACFLVSVGHLDVSFGEMSVHAFCPFLDWTVCFLGVEFKFFIDFWILALYLICHLQISSILSAVFWFYWLFPLLCKSFLSWWSPKSSFLLLFPLPLETCLERSCCVQCRSGYCLCSSLGFWWILDSHWELYFILSLSLCVG